VRVWFLNRDEFTRSRSLYVVLRPSVVCRMCVCNVHAPYTGD